jgi:hypothetical protein
MGKYSIVCLSGMEIVLGFDEDLPCSVELIAIFFLELFTCGKRNRLKMVV